MNLFKFLNDSSDNILFWHKINESYGQYSRLVLQGSKNTEKYIETLTNMFHELYTKVIKDTSNGDLNYLVKQDKGSKLENLQKEFINLYKNLHNQNGKAPDLNNVKLLCNTTLSLIETYQNGLFDITKNVLSSNMVDLKNKLNRKY